MWPVTPPSQALCAVATSCIGSEKYLRCRLR
jgi:hypothetical protein